MACSLCSRGGGGGGGEGTDSLSLGTHLETTAPPPLFGHGQAMVLQSPNLLLLFMGAQGQPLQIVTFR